MKRRPHAAAAALVFGLAGVAAIAGASTREDGRIDACRRPKTGVVRIVSSQTPCLRGETRLSWGGRGLRGEVGPRGETGHAGPPGPSGPSGPQGLAGPRGLTGATGEAGLDGLSGPIGPSGKAGPIGSTGAPGIAGAAGKAGATGIAGPAGAPGVAGSRGATGAAGPAGAVGKTGQTGPAGPAGKVGQPGAMGPAGAAGKAGTAGAHGATGSTGPAGATGPAGPVGPAGPAGQSGSSGSGLHALGDLAGISCTRSDGSTGVIELTTGADGAVRISCATTSSTPPPPPPPPPPSSGASTLMLNEVDYDQVGADGGGFVEIANAGTGAADLTGIALILVNGDGTEYGRIPLTGSLPAGSYLRVDADLQNGAPDGLALVDTAAASLLDSLAYEGEIRAATIDGKTFDLVEGTALAATVADSNTVNGSLSRLPNRTDTNNTATDWGFTTTPTPGAANVATS